MKKIFLQMGLITLLIGGIHSTAFAVLPQQVDWQHQNQAQIQAQPQVQQIPDLHFDPNAGGGVLGNPPIDYKTNVVSKIDSLIDAIKKASKRIEESKYISKENKEDILENIEDNKKKIEKIKNNAKNKSNFNQAIQEQFMLQIGSLFGELRLEIPKNIIEKQTSEAQQKVNKLEAISDKISIYISVAKKQGIAVETVEDKWTEGNERLISAKGHIDTIDELMGKIKPGVNFDKAEGYFKDANKEFRLAQKDIKTAKSLLGKSVSELKKVTKN